MKFVLITACLAMLAGCAHQNPEDQPVFGRVDCQDLQSHSPKTFSDFEVAQAICLPKGEAAAIAGTSGIYNGPGMGGAIASGIEAGISGARIQNATVLSCMAEHGFLYQTPNQHWSRCGHH